jgi:uncharacterized FlgJ-related protein
MIYKFDKKTLTFKSVTSNIVVILLSTILVATSVIGYVMFTKVNQIKYITQETKAVIIRENEKEKEFSPENLKYQILKFGIKYPRVVYAQAILESNTFKSNIFKVNNNLFGLKKAYRRPTTSQNSDLNHAYYNDWIECVVDYGFYQSQYSGSIRSEEEYLKLLGESYAEDPHYVERLKQIMSKN